MLVMISYKKCLIYILLFLFIPATIIMFFMNIPSNQSAVTINLNITPSVTSEACIVMNIDTREVYYEKNTKAVLLPASLTKVLTAITAIEYMDLKKYYQINYNDLLIEGSKIYLEPNEIINGLDLIYGIMLRSGNDASNVIANHYGNSYTDFICKMNVVAKKIGMNSSHFNNPTGLDEESENFTTAYDLAILMSYAMQNKLFYEIVNTKTYRFSSSSKQYLLINKHKLIHENCNFIGGKTGFTKKAHRTLISCFEKYNLRIVVVTLNASDDWNIHKKLANDVFIQINKDIVYE